MDIYTFDPTWLMVKRHKITGLLYFCKTGVNDPIKYNGSGKYWERHLLTHGRHVETLWSQIFHDRDDIIDFAVLFSELHDIVKAKDANGNKIWANLEIENGIKGMPPGTDRGEEFKEKCREWMHGQTHPAYGYKWWTNGITEIKSKTKPEGDEWVSGRFGLSDKINSTKTANGNHPSGSKNGRYDDRIHKFVNHSTGEIVLSTQYDFRISKNLSRRGVNRIVDGTRRIFKGWVVVKE